MSAPDGGCPALPGLLEEVAAGRTGRAPRVRGVTFSVKRASKRRLALVGATLPERPGVDYERPKSYGQCQRTGLGTRETPCLFVSCGHHLALSVNPATGSIKTMRPGLEIEDLPETCALRVADAGGATLEEVGALLNLTRERIRQIEYGALAKVRAAMQRAGLDFDDLTPERSETALPDVDWTQP